MALSLLVIVLFTYLWRRWCWAWVQKCMVALQMSERLRTQTCTRRPACASSRNAFVLKAPINDLELWLNGVHICLAALLIERQHSLVSLCNDFQVNKYKLNGKKLFFKSDDTESTTRHHNLCILQRQKDVGIVKQAQVTSSWKFIAIWGQEFIFSCSKCSAHLLQISVLRAKVKHSQRKHK